MTATDPIDQARRTVLAGLGTLALGLAPVRPASATAEKMAAAIAAFTGGAVPVPGRMVLEVASLVDNGNTVPVTVRVDSPMTASDYVAAIALFNERNPDSGIAVFTLGARAGKAEVSTRIRMATSQKLVAVARMGDNSFRMHSADVVVALAACIEGEA